MGNKGVQCSSLRFGGSSGTEDGSVGKESPAVQETQETEFNPWVSKIPWRRVWQPIPVLLPGEYHGQRSLVGYSPQGHKERHD